MSSKGKAQERPAGERHATPGRTDGDDAVTHRDVARRVRDADRFALQLPVVGRVPLPRPDQLAFYGALAALVAVELVEWPVAVATGAGHAIVSHRSSEKPQPGTSQPE